MIRIAWLLLPGFLLAGPPSPKIRFLHDDGGWCWFEDERAILVDGKLVFGVVAAGTRDPARQGSIEVVTHDMRSGSSKAATLHSPQTPAERKRWWDDHNSPALLLRPDGRVLAMYSLHGVDEKIYYRISEPHNTTAWGPEQIFVPTSTSKVTYSNLHNLTSEDHIYNFFRGLDNSFKPSYMYSDDLGNTWKTGNVFINVPLEVRHRPYVKYASNSRDTVHIAYTDGHPRNFDNSIYHIVYRDGQLRRSDGAIIRSLKEGLKSPEEGTRVFAGNPANVAWISDLHLDRQGKPFLVFSVQKDSAGLPSETAGLDHRYHYARWDGKQWLEHEIAYAGSKLYTGEDDYTGNIALDPADPNSVYISTNVAPDTGKPLTSKADGQRHWEIYSGTTKDRGGHWKWTAITSDSKEDQIRPILPIANGKRIALWLRGKMTAYTNYRFEVVGIY